MSLPKLYLSDFEIFHPLGGGHCGNVYLAKRKCDAALVALKVVDRYKISDHLGEQMRRDFVLLPTLKHPHLVEMYGHFFYDERIYISFEYINGGTLYQRLEKAGGGRFEDKEAAKYIAQVIELLEYFHKNNVYNRDIKPETLLLSCAKDQITTLKLSDFGWSINVPSNRKSTSSFSIEYAPPEILAKHQQENQPSPPYMADLWCLGILAYELLCGSTPFESGCSRETYRRILTTDFSFPSYVSKYACDFIAKLLVREPEKRMNLAAAQKHNWIAQCV